MKKVLLLVFLFLACLVYFTHSIPVFADETLPCETQFFSGSVSIDPYPLIQGENAGNSKEINFTLKADSDFFQQSKVDQYRVWISPPGVIEHELNGARALYSIEILDSKTLLIKWNMVSSFVAGSGVANYDEPGQYKLRFTLGGQDNWFAKNCQFVILAKGAIKQPRFEVKGSEIPINTPMQITLYNPVPDVDYSFWIDNVDKLRPRKVISYKAGNPNPYTFTMDAPDTVGAEYICMKLGNIRIFSGLDNCKNSENSARSNQKIQFTLNLTGNNERVSSAPVNANNAQGLEKLKAIGPFSIKRFECNGGGGIQTALGCIPTGSGTALAGWFWKWAVGIAGGVAFLVMLWAGFLIMTAAGNPERAQQGREYLTAAISGLLLIVFSLLLLKLIGVDILGIPGFGG